VHATGSDRVDPAGHQRHRDAVHRIDAVMRERARAKERAFAADLEAWRTKRSSATPLAVDPAASS
jgi:hypothetical protein